MLTNVLGVPSLNADEPSVDAEDTLSVQLMLGDKIEGIGTLDWKAAREEAPGGSLGWKCVSQ